MHAVELEGVSKRFGERTALDNITFKVESGRSILLVGTNGAGKSTMLRCILGIIGFTGNVAVYGMDVKRRGKDVRKLVGHVPQNIRYVENVTVAELVDYVSDLKRVDVYL
jgi:ABC-type multidrug transport system ATPase subunit